MNTSIAKPLGQAADLVDQARATIPSDMEAALEDVLIGLRSDFTEAESEMFSSHITDLRSDFVDSDPDAFRTLFTGYVAACGAKHAVDLLPGGDDPTTIAVVGVVIAGAEDYTLDTAWDIAAFTNGSMDEQQPLHVAARLLTDFDRKIDEVVATAERLGLTVARH